LLEASQQLQAGQNISRDVCSWLIYRTGSLIRESLWSKDGYLEHDTPIPIVPMGMTSFSPDYTKLMVETPASDTGGGPLYLFDLKTGELLNLNQRLGLQDYQGPLGLTMSGWHPDSRHFLLFDQNDSVIVWADLETASYQRIDLNQDLDFAPIRSVALTPDGNSFVYLVDGPNHEVIISRYDLKGQTITPLTTLDLGPNQLQSFRLSPTGEMAAYVIKKGQRQSGVSYILELLNMTTYSRTTLIEGNLGRTEPIWSPDGQKIAFSRKTDDTPDVAGVGQEQPWQGNIWVASVASGEVRQITFIEGAAYRPVWSPDSRFLAFITHTGEMGLAALDQPGLIWRLGASLAAPQLTSLNFVP
jgi:Tol biopolymer transport system component